MQHTAAPSTDRRPAWHSRGYMPHFDEPAVVQHVTFHLADSVPRSVLERLDRELRAAPSSWRAGERRHRLDDWIDAGTGCCLLGRSEAARMVEGALLHFDGQRYRLLAWVVMPNHVHALLHTMEGWTLPRVVASWKSFTGRRLAAMAPASLERGAPVWHREYWDRFIRDGQHFADVKHYIHHNPVKAGLVRRAEDWEWSSARVKPVEGEARLEPGVPG